MTPAITYTEHSRALMKLGLPLVGSLLASFAIGLTDMVMLGWFSVEALAAATLASSFFHTILIVGSGFAWAVTPMVAQAVELRRGALIRRTTRMGIWLSVGFAALVTPFLFFSEPWLLKLGQGADVSAGAQDYLRVAVWGLFPALIARVLTSYLSAMENTKPILWATLVVVALNVGLNWVLIFGRFGLPELGIQGAALASVLVNLMLCLFLGFYARGQYPAHMLFTRIWKRDGFVLGEVFRLGWPIALTNLAETGLFLFSSVMMGWLGTVALAAHGIALQVATATFMVHLGISQASTVRAGRALGRADGQGLKRGAWVAVGFSLATSVVAVIVFLAMPEQLVALFLSEDEPARDLIIPLGVSLVIMAALFQFADGLQVIALGLLRGVQDTRVPMFFAAIGYWVLGVPASYVLGFTLEWGGVGVWLGLVIGLGFAAVTLLWRFARRAEGYRIKG
ncbi:MAG: MATE family efflux transporter [Pseudomonadota bacterium]